MKKHINLWLVMFLAISLILPVCAMAADMNLRLMTQDGYSLTTNTPTISSFALDNDNNLVVILKDPPILDFGNPYPEITIDTPVTCTIINNAYVKGNPGTTFSFTVRTTTAGATLSSDTNHGGTSIVPDYYGASFVASGNTGTFSWNTAGNPTTPAGRYLAVFTATQTTYTSQLVVMINIALQYKLTLTAGANGSVSPAGDSYYDPGTSVSISATATTSGYYFSGWSGGDLSGSTTPTNVVMNSDKTITANFTQTPPTYTVTASWDSTKGTVSPLSRTVNSGDTATFTVTPSAGYTASVTDGSLSGTTWTTAPVTSNHTATVTFTQQSSCQPGDLPPTVFRDPGVSAGSWRFCVPANTRGLLVQAVGTTNETNATFAWTFPDGRGFRGSLLGTGTESVNLRLWGLHTPSPNIPDEYIPQGRHTLTITGNFSGFMSVGF